MVDYALANQTTKKDKAAKIRVGEIYALATADGTVRFKVDRVVTTRGQGDIGEARPRVGSVLARGARGGGDRPVKRAQFFFLKRKRENPANKRFKALSIEERPIYHNACNARPRRQGARLRGRSKVARFPGKPAALWEFYLLSARL